MSDVTNNSMKENKTEVNEEVDAFMTDMRIAKYKERVEKGLLTPEEQAARTAIRKFIGLE